MLKVYIKYLYVLGVVFTFNVFGASEEAADLLKTTGTSSMPPRLSMEIVNNFSYNIAALRKLGLIGATGDIETDMQAFPYLIRLMQGASAERTDAEILAMDLSELGESKAIQVCGAGEQKLRDGDFVGAMRCLLRAEMQGDCLAGEALEKIFEDPSAYKTSRPCIIHMMPTTEESTFHAAPIMVTSLGELFAPCSLLVDSYKMRALSSFPHLRMRQYLTDFQKRLAAAPRSGSDSDSTEGTVEEVTREQFFHD